MSERALSVGLCSVIVSKERHLLNRFDRHVILDTQRSLDIGESLQICIKISTLGCRVSVTVEELRV